MQRIVFPPAGHLASRLIPGVGWIGLATDLYHFVKAILGVIADLLRTLGQAVQVAGRAVGRVANRIAGMILAFIRGAFRPLLCAMARILDGLGTAVRSIIGFFQYVRRKIRALIHWVICKLADSGFFRRIANLFNRRGQRHPIDACAQPQGPRRVSLRARWLRRCPSNERSVS